MAKVQVNVWSVTGTCLSCILLCRMLSSLRCTLEVSVCHFQPPPRNYARLASSVREKRSEAVPLLPDLSHLSINYKSVQLISFSWNGRFSEQCLGSCFKILSVV